MNRYKRFLTDYLLVVCIVLLLHSALLAQFRQGPGKPIGKISLDGNLIVMELDEGALGNARFFDLNGRTLRFTPEASRYRVENTALQWDADFGTELKQPQVALDTFAFPFSGKTWNSLFVGRTGVVTFGTTEREGQEFTGGLPIARFDELADAAYRIIDSVPAICVFLKPRMSGPRYVKKLADRVVITWDLTEPHGNIQDFTWVKTTNRFQLVLKQDGSIDMSYDQLAAKDAIVGLYPMLTAGTERVLTTIKHQPDSSVPAHLDIRNLKVSDLENLLLKVTLQARGPVLKEGDAALPGIAYRIHFAKATQAEGQENPANEIVWTIRGFGPRREGARGTSRYFAFGEGVLPKVIAEGDTISIEGIPPKELTGSRQVMVSVDVSAPGNAAAGDFPGAPGKPVERVPAHPVKLLGIRSPEVHLSSLTRQDGPFPMLFESFHYLALPNNRDLACTVIKALGDKFDLLAYYSDFRIDNQEAGTPSNGPVGGNVTGIGQTEHDLAGYCSAGRFQWGFVQPVYAGSNQMQERPPAGTPIGTTRDITYYSHQLEEVSGDGTLPPYMYAMSQIGHEMGHRWSAFVSAKVNGETIQLGPVHWARGLQAQVAFPYRRPTEASAMGGGVWQDNFDGTFTQLDDDYYVPATGWSYLDLYLMGLISPAEVPDFFILRNLVPAGKDANGHPIFKADRTKVTIQDVIAAEGPRLPDVEHSQRKFNTGFVVMVEHGKKPSRELIERTNGIRDQWMKYWEITTGHRSTMRANPE